MKCAICHGKTDWDSSFGYETFIVCRPCFDKLSNRDLKNCAAVRDFIFACGQIRRDKKKEILK